ncbi:unnamed protein product [Ixodes pacificus]
MPSKRLILREEEYYVVHPQIRPANPMGSPLTVTYLMGVLMCLSLFTLAAFVFAYIVYKEIPEQQKVKFGSYKGLLNTAIKYHVCNHTYCKAAARQYSRHAKLPLNMCEQLTQSLCDRNIISQTKKNSSLSPPSMQKGRLFLDDLNIDAMLKENYFPIDQLREFLHMCVKATKNSGKY